MVVERIRGALRTRFARDAAFLQIAAFVNQGSSFLTSVLVFRVCGIIAFGVYAEALNTYALLFFLGNVGFAQLVVARIAEGMGRNDPAAARRWLGFFLAAYGTVSVAICAIGFLVGPWIGETFQHDRQVGVWAAILGLSGPLSVPFYLVQCALHGTRRMRLLAQMENLKELVRGYLVVAGVLAVGDPLGAIVGEVVATALSAVFAAVIYYKARRQPGLPLPSVRAIVEAATESRWADVKEGLRIGIAMTSRKNLTVFFLTILPRFLLGWLGTAQQVAYLNLAQSLMRLPILALAGISRTLIPALGQLRGAGRENELAKLLVRVMGASGGIVTAGAGAFAISLYWLVPFFYGDTALPALELVPALFISTVLAGFAVGVESFYLVVDRLRVAILIDVATAIAVFVPGILLISAWQARGAAVYVALCHAGTVAHLLYVLRYLRSTPATTPSRHSL